MILCRILVVHTEETVSYKLELVKALGVLKTWLHDTVRSYIQ